MLRAFFFFFFFFWSHALPYVHRHNKAVLKAKLPDGTTMKLCSECAQSVSPAAAGAPAAAPAVGVAANGPPPAVAPRGASLGPPTPAPRHDSPGPRSSADHSLASSSEQPAPPAADDEPPPPAPADSSDDEPPQPPAPVRRGLVGAVPMMPGSKRSLPRPRAFC
jgi:hypothetical protein